VKTELAQNPRSLREPDHGTRWVEIPPGSFWMGGIEYDKFVSSVELPRHKVVVSESFSMARWPVTCGEWLEVMNRLPCAVVERDPQLPVVGVSWTEALAYCLRLGERDQLACRLPSEAEWEYVCRAGSSGVFPDGNTIDPACANYLYDELGHKVGPGKPSKVGSYGTNAFGVADLLGNVCEWTADVWHAGFIGAPGDGTAWVGGPATGRRVIRGGGWDHLPRVLRASWRDWAPENARWDNLGFRPVIDRQQP